MGQAGSASAELLTLGGCLEKLGDDELLRAAFAFLHSRPSLLERARARFSAPLDFEDPGPVTPQSLATGGITILAESEWSPPRLHCSEVKPGQPLAWTSLPGLAMAGSRIEGFPGFWALRFPGARKLEFLLNDGYNNWQKNGGANFVADGPGLFLLRDGKLRRWAEGAAAPQAAQTGLEELTGDALEMAKEGGIVFLFQSRWAKPRLHYRLSEAEPWTSPPGEAMEPSGLRGFPHRDGWWALRLPTAQALECVPNDGGSQWHKVRGGNCHLPGPGAWTLMGENLQKLGQAQAVEATAKRPQAAPPAAPDVPVSDSAPPVTLEPASEGLRLLEMLEGKNVVLLYRSAWASPHLHCRELTAEGTAGAWSQLPGLPFAASAAAEDLEGAGELFVARLPAKVRGLEFVLNDGGPHYRWDKAAGGGNFRIPPKSEGVWLVSGGRLEKLQPPPSPSDAPAVTAVTRTSVALSWRPAASSVKGYRLFRNGKQVASLASAVLQYTDAGLMAAHEYTYALAAVSTQGALGSASPTACATTEAAGPPGKVGSLRVAAASGRGISLEWTAPEDTGGAPVTAYLVQRSDKEVPTTLLASQLAGEKREKFAWTDKDIVRGSSYSYTVLAAHLPPLTEKELREAVLKERQATIPPEEDHFPQVAEEFNLGAATGPVETTAVDALEVGPCHESLREHLAEVQGKKMGVTVFYKSCWGRTYAHCCAQEDRWSELPGVALEASPCHAFSQAEDWLVLCLPYARSLELVMNDGGRGWDKAPGGKNYKVMTPGVFVLTHGHLDPVALPPQQPQNLTAEAVDGSRVQLLWEPPALADGEAPVKSYRIFRNGRLIGQTETTSCYFLDINLFAFTDYEYSVAAVNGQDVAGPLSDAASVKTKLPGLPTAPRNLRANTRKEHWSLVVSLEWEPPADCGGAPVASYEILRDGSVIDIYEVPNARIRSEAEAAKPLDPEAAAARRWVRSTCSYSNLSWFKDGMAWTDTGVQLGECYSYQVRAVQLGPERATQLKEGGVVQRCGSQFLDNVLPDVIGPASEPAQVRATAFLDPPKLGEQRCIIMFQAFDWGSHKAPSWYKVLLGLLPELRSAGINMCWLPPPSDSVDDHGYLPRKWYVLDNNYGTAEELQHLIGSMHEQEIWPVLDVVVNHRCASLQDSAGRWLKFEEPDWEGWAVCCNSPAVPGGSGAHTTGEPAAYAPSVDHSNPRIRSDVNEYIRYLMDEIGFRALRFDFVKGYAPRFQTDYVKAAGEPFAVAENWNGDVNGLHDYVRECQGKMAVYDFPLYYVLKRCIHSNNFEELNCGGRLAGIAGRDPARSCTFIDNHDTYQLAIVGGCFGNNDQVLRAYALILTHPGTPCVFHWDYVRAPYVREKLLELCAVRRDANVHSTSQLHIHCAAHGLYAATIGGNVAIKIGTNDWSPGGGWKVGCFGAEFCVWTKG